MKPISLPSRGMGACGVYMATPGTTIWPPRSVFRGTGARSCRSSNPASLAIAPAFVLAQRARWVDLDGPALLARDRESGFEFREGRIGPPVG